MEQFSKLSKAALLSFFAAAIIDAFVFDRIIKYLVMEFVFEDMVLIPGFLKISLQVNTGIAFSIGLPYMLQLLITPLLLIVGAYIVARSFNTKSLFVMIVSGLIAGGALGNYFDRIYYGHVIDYISIWKYPVFNLADIFITIGIFLLIVFYGRIGRTN